MKVAQVGLGRRGRSHAGVLARIGVLGAVCDPDAARCAECGRMYSANHYPSAESMLASEEFDAAVVATPSSAGSDMARVLLEGNKHVLMDGLLAPGPEDCRALVRLADKRGLVLAYGHAERFNPAVAAARRLIRKGACGDPVMINLRREDGISPHAGDAGVIRGMAVPDIDVANRIFDAAPSVVFAIAGSITRSHEDFASIMLGYGGGRTATISSSRIAPQKIGRMAVACTEATVSLDLIGQGVTVQRRNGDVQEAVSKQEPLYIAVRNFVDSISGGSAQTVTPLQALHLDRVAEAALLSSSKGVPIYLDLR